MLSSNVINFVLTIMITVIISMITIIFIITMIIILILAHMCKDFVFICSNARINTVQTNNRYHYYYDGGDDGHKNAVLLSSLSDG